MLMVNKVRLLRITLCLIVGWVVLVVSPQATRLPAHTALRAGQEVRAVALSPDGRSIAAGTMWGGINMWDASSGQRRNTPAQSSRTLVYSVEFSPDGRLLASSTPCGPLGCVQLWETTTGQLVRAIEGHARGVQVTDRKGDVRRVDLPGDVGEVRFSPDGRLLASAGSDGAIELRDVSSGQLVRDICTESPVLNIAFHPDGRVLAASLDGAVRLWDVDSGALVRVIQGRADVVSNLIYSPDGRTLAWGEADQHIRLWDASSGQLLNEFEQDARILSLAFRPDGRVLAAGDANNHVWLWDVASGQLLRTYRAHRWRPFDNGVSALGFSADGDTLVSGGEDGRVVLWDLSERSAARASICVTGGIGVESARVGLQPTHEADPGGISLLGRASMAPTPRHRNGGLPRKPGEGEEALTPTLSRKPGEGEERARVRALPLPRGPTVFGRRYGGD